MNKPIKDYPLTAEQYLIANYEAVKEENETLRLENASLLDQLNEFQTIESKDEDVKVLPELLNLFTVNVSNYEIDENNINHYKDMLKNKTLGYYDYNSYFYINRHTINAKINISNYIFYCNVRFKGMYQTPDIVVYDIEDKKYFHTEVEAFNKLYELLDLEIQRKEKIFADKKAKEKEVKENEKTV